MLQPISVCCPKEQSLSLFNVLASKMLRDVGDINPLESSTKN